MSFNSTTPITLSLQARDWFHLGFIMKGDDNYENLGFALKVKMQVATPPAGTDLVEITNEPLGVILRLFHQINERYGKEVGKSARNRFRVVLEALANQEITDYFTELDASVTALENAQQELGRKWLRGKLA